MLTGRAPGNPADIPGVVIHQPEPDLSLRYDAETGWTVDIVTGQRLWLRSPHNEGAGMLQLNDQSKRLILIGNYYLHFVWEGDGATIYDIARLNRDLLERELVELDYELGRVAQFIKARHDRGRPRPAGNVVVVDTRPVRVPPPLR